MTVAALTPDPGERVSLLRGIELALGTAPPTDWGAALSASAAGELAAELRIEKAYDALSVSTLAAANTRAANGDLRGVQALVERVLQADDRLGRKRPQNTSALLGALEWRLAEAARVRAARDAWALRLTAFSVYGTRSRGRCRNFGTPKKSSSRSANVRARRDCCCRAWSSTW